MYLKKGPYQINNETYTDYLADDKDKQKTVLNPRMVIEKVASISA